MTERPLHDRNGDPTRQQPQVKLLSREFVLPATPSPPQPFFLSCFDIYWQDVHYNRRLLFYSQQLPTRHGDEQQARTPMVQLLKSSLANCLVYYFPWCGRLAKPVDPPQRLFIDCNDAGVEFVEASVDMPLCLLQDDGFQMRDFFDLLCQLPEHKGDCLFSSPLLSIQANIFSDGGLALGVAQSHVVADGQSLWDFMVSWGECSRGVSLRMPPVIDRRILELPNPSLEKATWSLDFNPVDDEEEVAILDGDNGKGGSTQSSAGTPVNEKSTLSHDKIQGKNGADTLVHGGDDEAKTTAKSDADNGDEQTDSAAESGGKMDPKPDLVQWMFTIPASTIKKLKEEVGREGFTSFEVMCAHLWQRFTIARKAPPREVTYLYLPINCRSRLSTQVARAYFGNVIGVGPVISRAHRICKEAAYCTANRIHRELVAVTASSLDAFMHWLEMHDNRIMNAFTGEQPVMKGLNVASSPHFPAYEVDFGWGKPAAVRAAKVTGNGELVLFGGRPGSQRGDVEICTALPSDVLKRLLQDPVFAGEPPHIH